MTFSTLQVAALQAQLAETQSKYQAIIQKIQDTRKQRQQRLQAGAPTPKSTTSRAGPIAVSATVKPARPAARRKKATTTGKAAAPQLQLRRGLAQPEATSAALANGVDAAAAPKRQKQGRRDAFSFGASSGSESDE